MIKVLINNEEVVSNHNLEIKEEMLSTSSTILKNCYPKVWENDKDYVSRFYYPKDYSKCKIYNLPRENTTQEQTGTNLSFETYLGKSTIEDIKFYGNTLQNGTPTPSSPVEIQSVTGLQTINITGKNLFGLSNTGTNIGVTYTFNGSELTLNGTTTGEGNIYNNTNVITLPAGTYTFSSKILSGNFTKNNRDTAIYFKNSNNARETLFTITGAISYNNTSTITLNEEKTVRLQIYTNGTNMVFNNLKIGIQLEQSSTATTYEPYKGNTYEINLGKNLLDISKARLGTFNGLTISYSNGEILLNGTATALVDFYVATKVSPPTYNEDLINYMNNNIGAYTLSNNLGFENYFRIGGSYPQNTGTTTSTNKVDLIFVRIPAGTYNNKVLNIQLEKGSQATSYSPYFTPIELNKIGTYQDYIRKSTGKNLFDKDNANVIDTAFINGSTGAIESDNNSKLIYIPCKSNTTYTISKVVTSRFRASYSTNIPAIGVTTSGVISNYTGTSITITTGATAKYLVVWVYNSGLDTMTFNEILATIQIEENSTATDLEPYGVGKWYKYSAIGKAVLDGSETYTSASTNTSRKYRIRYSGVVDLIKRPTTSGTVGDIISNQFIPTYANNTYRCNQGISAEINGTITFYDKTITQSITAFTTWLTSNNMTIYYVLATPTVEEITNTELINQLESLNIQLYEGQTNFIIDGSLPMPTYIKIYTNFEELIFCGFTKNTGNVSLNPREFHGVDLQILDFKDLLSTGETLNYVIANKTIIEAINQVVNSISDYGFVVGNIEILNPDDIIGAYSTLNKTAYDVFQYFAEITQSRWSTRLIDENTIAIDFYDPSLMPTGVDIDKTQTFYENYKIIDMSFNYSTNDYRNKQIMTSDEVYANITQTETIIADGYATSFMCQNKIGIITSIKLNGVERSYATKSEEQLGITADFVYQPGETTFTSNNSISAGGIIVITYYPIVKGREIILNNTESDRIESQINRNGTISRYENRNDTTSSQELQKIGQSYIKYKGNAEINLKIVSELNTWNVGEIVSYNAPISELSTTYMVKSKQISMYLNANKIIYTYNLTSNYNCENAVNYFDNQRAKNQGNIGEGETITRNIDLESTALIKFYDTNVEEIQVQNPTSLDFALDGVLI